VRYVRVRMRDRVRVRVRFVDRVKVRIQFSAALSVILGYIAPFSAACNSTIYHCHAAFRRDLVQQILPNNFVANHIFQQNLSQYDR